MVVLLDNKVMVHIGQVRRIWIEKGETHIMGEWGYLHAGLPESAFDRIACQLTVLPGVLLDCTSDGSSIKVDSTYVNGAAVPPGFTSPLTAAPAPETPKAPRKPKAEPAAAPAPLDKDKTVNDIVGIVRSKGDEVYTAWSNYLMTRYNIAGVVGLKDLDDAKVVSFNNKIVDSFRDGKLYPWDVDSTYAKPNLKDDEVNGFGDSDDDMDEGFGEPAAVASEPELYDKRLARIVVEMAEMPKPMLDALVTTMEKGVEGKHLLSADPLKMISSDLDKIITKLDQWHEKGKLQPLSATALARIVAITEPFAE